MTYPNKELLADLPIFVDFGLHPYTLGLGQTLHPDYNYAREQIWAIREGLAEDLREFIR